MSHIRMDHLKLYNESVVKLTETDRHIETFFGNSSSSGDHILPW